MLKGGDSLLLFIECIIMKRFKIGMYGGKFLPLHKGHGYCIDVAASECEKVYAILFWGGADEERICREFPYEYLSPHERMIHLLNISGRYHNVIAEEIDISSLRTNDGSEDWDAETPLVRKICGGRIDAVYSSEESYSEYFSRAYPEALHRLVDVERIHFPISGTVIRHMNTEEERNKWTI